MSSAIGHLYQIINNLKIKRLLPDNNVIRNMTYIKTKDNVVSGGNLKGINRNGEKMIQRKI